MNASCQEEHLGICLGFLPLAHSSRNLPARHTKCEEPWWLRVSIFLFQAFSMRFRLEHVRSKKGPAGARFSKVPVTERTPKAVLFSFKREGGSPKVLPSYTLKPPEVIHI